MGKRGAVPVLKCVRQYVASESQAWARFRSNPSQYRRAQERFGERLTDLCLRSWPPNLLGHKELLFLFFLLQEGLAASCLLTARFIQPSRMTVLFPLLATRLYKQARLGEWTIPKRGLRANQFELRKGPGV